MAFLFADSFDFYTLGTNADLTTYGPWTTASGNCVPSNAFTRFASGKSLSIIASSSILTKTNVASTANTMFAAFPRYFNGTASGVTTTYYDGVFFNQGGSTAANNQVVVLFRADGAIEVRRGAATNLATTGTTIATFTSAWAANIWDHWQIKVVFHATAGEVRIRKNGATSDTFAATGLNTLSTANAYCDSVILATMSSSVTFWDDFLVCDNSGSGLVDWPGDVRSYPLSPVANTAQKDFTPGASGSQVISNSAVSTATQATTSILFTKFTPTMSGALPSFTMETQISGTPPATANIKFALYDATGVNGPGAVLATGSRVVPNTVLTTFQNTFSVAPTVVAGVDYYLAFITDVSCGFAQNSSSSASNKSIAGQTYAAGCVANPTGTVTSPASAVYMIANITYDNVGAIQASAPDGDISYNYSSTLGAEDLFDLPDLPATPSSIYLVNARLIARKSDAGSRSAAVVLKSGGATDVSPDYALNTAYTALNKTYLTDPATGLPWTAAAINALQAGYKVSV